MTASTRTFAIGSQFQPVKRFFRTPKGLLLVALALLAAVAATHEGVRLILPGVFGAMLAAALLDVGLARIVRGAWFFPSGALLSGLIVALIISPTESPRVAAVTGNPRVANRSSLVAELQTLEFTSIVSLLRRAQVVWGRILTVSGVIST